MRNVRFAMVTRPVANHPYLPDFAHEQSYERCRGETSVHGYTKVVE